jgi:hypothetical protein
MRTGRAILLSGAAVCAVWSTNLWGQGVQVTSDKGVVTLSMTAQTAHVSGQAKTPVLSVVCQQKGKKFTHEITFEPGGMLTEQEYSSFGKRRRGCRTMTKTSSPTPMSAKLSRSESTFCKAC